MTFSSVSRSKTLRMRSVAAATFVIGLVVTGLRTMPASIAAWGRVRSLAATPK